MTYHERRNQLRKERFCYLLRGYSATVSPGELGNAAAAGVHTAHDTVLTFTCFTLLHVLRFYSVYVFYAFTVLNGQTRQ